MKTYDVFLCHSTRHDADTATENTMAMVYVLLKTSWDLAPEGKRVAVVIPEGSAQAPQQEHEIVMLLNFADELRRRVPAGK